MSLQAADSAHPGAPTPAPEDVLEPALRGLVATASAAGGAVCLFDWGDAVLRLAAETGLSDDGCRLLRALRAGDDSWPGPLACLRERQPCVQVAGAETLPPLLGGNRPAASVACIPLLVAERALGVVILVAHDPDAFSPAALCALGPALEALAGIVDAIHRRVATLTGRDDGRPSFLDAVAATALRGIAPVLLEAGRLLGWASRLPGVGPLAEQLAAIGIPEADRMRRLQETTAQLRAECERLTTEREAANERAQSAIETTAAELARERQQSRREHEQLASELAEALAREQRTRAELDATLARAATDRTETLRQARELAASAEEQRAASAAEAATTRAKLATAEANILGLRDEVRRLAAENERLELAEHAARVGREQVHRAVEEARRREAEAVDRARELEGAFTRAETERLRLEQAARDRSGEIEVQWAARLAAAEAEGAREHERVQTLERELARQSANLTEAAEREARLQDEIQTLRGRGSAEREETLRLAREMAETTEQARAATAHELEAVREAMAEAQAIILHMEAVAALDQKGAADRERLLTHTQEINRQNEQARAAAIAEAEGVHSRMVALQSEVVTARDELRRANEESTRLRTACEALEQERGRLAASCEEARTVEAGARERTAGLEQEARTLRAELARLSEAHGAELTAAEERWRARIAEALAEAAEERQRARQFEHERERLTAQLGEALAGQQSVHDEIMARAAADRDETLRHAQELTEAAERAREAAAAETEAIRTALASSQRLILESEDEARRALAEVERLRTSEEAALAEQRKLTAQLEDLRAREVEAAAALERTQQELRTKPQAPAPAEPKAAATAPKRSSAAVRPVVAVIDLDEAWPSAGEVKATAVKPGPEVVDRVRELDPGRIMVNLAATGAFAMMGILRQAGCPTPFIGCLAVPGGADVILLGSVEPLPRPPDPEVLLAALGSARGLRIMAAGTDANAFISLRQALSRAGMSVSIAWDLKQAGDLVEIVNPQVLVFDLTLPPRGPQGLVAQLGANQKPPMLFLIPGPADPAAAFAAALGDKAAAGGLMPRRAAVEQSVRRRIELAGK